MSEDDTYSTIFTALKHPIRRKILRILNQQPTTYTEILNQLNIENGLLNYHLDNMKDLITKGEDGKYSLSDFGGAAISVTEKVEGPVKSRSNLLSANQMIRIILILIVAIASLSVLGFLLYNKNTMLLNQNTMLLNQIETANVVLGSSFGASISRVQAITIALRNGGWNSTGLKGMKVDSNLAYCSPVDGNLHFVNSTVTDFSPKSATGVMYRYFWLVTVDQSVWCGYIRPTGYYEVDAVTGEIIPLFNW
ncbi:MAG: winged helix-turn-helix domain-containing protein [Candidatus Bathyarchaeia archaeon]|jgi:DNA-binding transcriptional ArsR family regulator